MKYALSALVATLITVAAFGAISQSEATHAANSAVAPAEQQAQVASNTELRSPNEFEPQWYWVNPDKNVTAYSDQCQSLGYEKPSANMKRAFPDGGISVQEDREVVGQVERTHVIVFAHEGKLFTYTSSFRRCADMLEQGEVKTTVPRNSSPIPASLLTDEQVKAIAADTFARSQQWYYVVMTNSATTPAQQCLPLPKGQSPLSSLTTQYGADNVKMTMDSYIDSDNSYLQIFVHGDSNYAFSTSTFSCLKTRAAILQHIASKMD